MIVQNFVIIVRTVFEKFEIFMKKSGEKKQHDCISRRKFFPTPKKDQYWANEAKNEYTDSLSTSTKQRGVFARGPSSLISSRKRLEVVKDGFSPEKRKLTGSSSLVDTLGRNRFAFDLYTATLVRWKI